MNLTRSIQPLLFLFLIVRALIVQTAQDNNIELSLLPSQSASIHRLNQTPLFSDTAANRLGIYCDGNEYGRDLMAADCRDAITAIKRNKQELRFAERSTDPETWDVGLPSRQIGSEDAAEETTLESPSCQLTSKQYWDFAPCSWNLSLACHPLLLPHLTYPKPPSLY